MTINDNKYLIQYRLQITVRLQGHVLNLHEPLLGQVKFNK